MEKGKRLEYFCEINRNAFRDEVYNHSILTGAYGVSVIVFAATSLMNGLILSFLFIQFLLPVCLLSQLVYSRVKRPLRMILIFFTMILEYTVFLLLSYDKILQIPMLNEYSVLLLAVSPLLFSRAGKAAIVDNPLRAIIGAIYCALAFAAAACTVGGVRELLAEGTLFGYEIFRSNVRISAMQFPFVGFIILGFFAATIKGIRGINESKNNKETEEKMSQWRINK